MRDLVPEMAQQRAIGLAHPLALAFAFGRVRFRHVERDEAARMAGHDRRLVPFAVRRPRQEIKGEPVRILGSRRERQAQPQQRVEKAMLGVFDPAPMHEILSVGEIGDGAIVAARGAKNLGILGSHQPIADVVPGIGAEAISLALGCKRAPKTVGLFQCGDDFLLWQIAEPQPAALALRILEIEQLPAVLTLEKFHDLGHSDGTLHAQRIACRFRAPRTAAGRRIVLYPSSAARRLRADSRSSPSGPRPTC